MASQVDSGLRKDSRDVFELVFTQLHHLGEKSRYVQVVMDPIGGQQDMAAGAQPNGVKLGRGRVSSSNKLMENLATSLIMGDLNAVYEQSGVPHMSNMEGLVLHDGYGQGCSAIVPMTGNVVMGLCARHLQGIMGGWRVPEQFHDRRNRFDTRQISTGMPAHAICDDQDSPIRVKVHRVFIIHSGSLVTPGATFEG
jgi:hypothetical protein